MPAGAARRGRRREPPGVGPRGGARRVWGGCAYAPRVRAGREPVGARHAAPGACILSDTGCIQAGLAEVEGIEQTVEIGALQPQGLGRRRMIALGLGQRLAQHRAL